MRVGGGSASCRFVSAWDDSRILAAFRGEPLGRKPARSARLLLSSPLSEGQDVDLPRVYIRASTPVESTAPVSRSSRSTPLRRCRLAANFGHP